MPSSNVYAARVGGKEINYGHKERNNNRRSVA
jgi:hypothetical protein